ncbi:MAG: GTPase Era [Synergistaceae bacterium]|jgi:GTP-binding protein Era|nr:GTPase Era [Synergistaceae bacterium]
MAEDGGHTASKRRAGFVALVGRPNVGKSSIVNAMLREKVAAVSSKPQTTRNAVRCVLTEGEYQMVIVDTPGLHKPRHELGEFMVREAEGAMERVDIICFVTEAGRRMGPEEEEIVCRIARLGVPVVLAANKVDRLRDKECFWRNIGGIAEKLRPAALVPLSAKDGTNLDVLEEELSRLLPDGDFIYPEDVLMDATERFLAEEIIREKIFESTEQEVPHSVAVVAEEFKSPDEYPEMRRIEIRANIIVERAGQKGIVIGERGAMLKSIGSAARLEMEARFGHPVFLQLWVKVKPGWRRSRLEMERAGYPRR